MSMRCYSPTADEKNGCTEGDQMTLLRFLLCLVSVGCTVFAAGNLVVGARWKFVVLVMVAGVMLWVAVESARIQAVVTAIRRTDDDGEDVS